MSETPQTPSYNDLMAPLQDLRRRTEEIAGPTGSRVFELMAQAETDELTGLRNRKGLQSELEKRIYSDDEEQFALVFVDLDGFKAVNDTHGHGAGDSVLKNVGKFFKQASEPKKSPEDKSFKFRNKGDEAFRLGGDEFVILIKTQNTENSRRKKGRTEEEFIVGFNERLSEGIIKSGYAVDDTIEIDGSFGFAQHLPGETIEDFIARADKEMYTKKLLKKAMREFDIVYSAIDQDPVEDPFSGNLTLSKEIELGRRTFDVKDTNNLAANFCAWAKQQSGYKKYFDYDNAYLTDNYDFPAFMSVNFKEFASAYPNMTRVLLATNRQYDQSFPNGKEYRMLLAQALFDSIAPAVWNGSHGIEPKDPVELLK